MAMTPEGRVKAAVKKLLKARGIWHYMPVQNGMGVVGIPDIICCWDGMLVALETKAPNKNPTTIEQRWKKATPNQQNRITEINEAGGIAMVVDDVEQVRMLLDYPEFVRPIIRHQCGGQPTMVITDDSSPA